MVAPRVWARQTGLLEPKDACGRVVAHSEVTSQIAQSGDYSREVAICLGIGALLSKIDSEYSVLG